MASRTTLNARNLETLGSAALAELLIEISAGSAAAKRRLRLALAGGQGAKEAAAEVRKRLLAIAKSRARIGWRQRKTMAEDLAAQRRAILDQISPADAAEAYDLLWQFLTLANSVLARCDDKTGAITALFREGCAKLGPLAEAAGIKTDRLADRVMDAVMENQHGQFDGLIRDVAPTLGGEGLAVLKTLARAIADRPVEVPPPGEWRRVGMSLTGPVYAHQREERQRRVVIDRVLKDIADAMGDVDAFIAGHSAQARKLPEVATDIATRLLAAGRAEEALRALDHASPDATGPQDWQEARLAALEALGRAEEAQGFRWQCFSRTLAIPHLRAHLKRLPDFEDVEAEERALSHAADFPDATLALGFLTQWPAWSKAAALARDRVEELDGDRYDILIPAAEALEARSPLAAVLLLRRLIDATLAAGRSSRYPEAAGLLGECAKLDTIIGDYEGRLTHERYLGHLRAEHPRKSSFWAEVA